MRRPCLLLIASAVFSWTACTTPFDTSGPAGARDREAAAGSTEAGAAVRPSGAAADGPTSGGDAGGDGAGGGAGGNEATCQCLASQPKVAYCAKHEPCKTDSDCCNPQSPIPCGVYGNRFTCQADGSCTTAGCMNAAECITYAEAIKQPGAADYTCHSPACPGAQRYCATKSKTCNKATDCCDANSKSPCGVYPNRWSCQATQCVFAGCDSTDKLGGDGECVQYAQAHGLAGDFTCRPLSCYEISYCAGPARPCTKPSDCCNAQSPIPCGVYGNRYRCVDDQCAFDHCSGDQDCKAYAQALNTPDADQYRCVQQQ